MRKLIKNISVALTMAMCISTVAGCAGSTMKPNYAYNASDYISLGEYKGLTVEYKDDFVVDEKDLQDAIDQILDQNKTYEVVEREAKEGDQVSLSFVAKISGGVVEGFSSNDYQLIIGENLFVVEGFEQKLIGLKAGDERAITGLHISEKFELEPSYAGKAITYDVSIKSVAEPTLPEYNDALVSAISGGKYATVDEYNKELMKYLEENQTMNKDDAKRENLIEQVVANTQVIKELPEDYVATKVAALQKEVDMLTTFYSMDLETYMMKNYGVSTLEEEAKREIVLEMIFQSIIEKEKITITKKYYDEHLEETAKNRGFSSVEKFLKNTTEDGAVLCMLADKAEAIILESAIEK